MTVHSTTVAASLIAAMVSLTLISQAPAYGAQFVAAPQHVQSASAKEAAALADSFHSALKRGDATAVTALLADNVIIYEEGEAELNKAQYVKAHLPADIAFVSAVSEQVIRRNGGGSKDYAWVASQGRTTGRYEGHDVDRLTTETMIVQHFASGWRIVHIHWSSRLTPKN